MFKKPEVIHKKPAGLIHSPEMQQHALPFRHT